MFPRSGSPCRGHGFSRRGRPPPIAPASPLPDGFHVFPGRVVASLQAPTSALSFAPAPAPSPAAPLFAPAPASAFVLGSAPAFPGPQPMTFVSQYQAAPYSYAPGRPPLTVDQVSRQVLSVATALMESFDGRVQHLQGSLNTMQSARRSLQNSINLLQQPAGPGMPLPVAPANEGNVPHPEGLRNNTGPSSEINPPQPTVEDADDVEMS